MSSRQCRWINLESALTSLVNSKEHQGSEHIIGLHWYVASRLVVEGGFHPRRIVPRPPFDVVIAKGEKTLVYDESLGGTGETTILGGLKTKKVDVVVAHEGIGPCLAVSIKGTQRAVRNLSNRLEESVGDCTNLHISYPALVYGFLHVIQANKEGAAPEFWPHARAQDGSLRTSDVVLHHDGRPQLSIVAYHDALARLADRFDMRDDPSRYEAIALVLAGAEPSNVGVVSDSYPHAESPLNFKRFFGRLYESYDRRFVYSASVLAKQTRRLLWSPASPALQQCTFDYVPRLSSDVEEEEREEELLGRTEEE